MAALLRQSKRKRGASTIRFFRVISVMSFQNSFEDCALIIAGADEFSSQPVLAQMLSLICGRCAIEWCPDLRDWLFGKAIHETTGSGNTSYSWKFRVFSWIVLKLKKAQKPD